jgi:DNA-binding CsgD family transcriptional regulator
VLIYRAPQVAAELLRAVLAQLPGDDPGREALEAALVQAAFLLNEHDEVERVGRRALVRAGDTDRAAEITWLVAYTLMRTGRAGEGEAATAEALTRPGPGQVQRVRLHGLHALSLVLLGRVADADKIAVKALESAEAIGDRFAAGYALHALSCVSFLRPDHVSRLAHIDRALAVIGDDPVTADLRLVLLSNKVSALVGLCRPAEALTTARQALALAERTGLPRATAGTALASVYFDAGRWDDALAELEMLTSRPGPDYPRVLVHGLSAVIAVHRDDQDAMDKHLALAADVPMHDTGSRANAASLLLARALAAERAGQAAQAVAAVAQCLDPGFAEDIPGRYVLLPSLVRLALAAGDPATAAAGAQAAARDAELEPLPLETAAADHCRGLVGADPALLLRSASYYESASFWPVDRAQALEDATVLLARRGDLEAAHAAFSEAISLYDALGAEWDIRRARSRVRGLGVRRVQRRRVPLSVTKQAALTPTEIKIAHLVAEGKSNPEIAAGLFLSRNTVQTHVSHILAKLGARSRAEIVRAGSLEELDRDL